MIATIKYKKSNKSASSQRWLKRQLKDIYVLEAQKQGYRSRAAFKLKELDDKYKFLKPGKKVIELGAAPGGWSQIIVDRVKSKKEQILLTAIDITKISPINGAKIIEGNFLDSDIQKKITYLADVILSDMAEKSTGHKLTDHLKIMSLAEDAFEFSKKFLKTGGTFIIKIFLGGNEKKFYNKLQRHFDKVYYQKPKSSRKNSSEIYVVATNLKK